MLPSEEIKEKINIVDLIGEYVQLKKAGINFRAVCPFHQEKTPSFMVSATKQIWHCFGCGLGGDVFEFLKQMEGVDFSEALRILAPRAGVTLRMPSVEYKNETDKKGNLFAINELAAKYFSKVLEASTEAESARQYLQTRGFKPETIKTWQLGYAPDDFHIFENFIVKKGFQKSEAVAAGLLVEKDPSTSSGQTAYFDRFRGRIMFPLFDAHGRVVGFTARILNQSEEAAKYINSPETLIYKKRELIYGLHRAKIGIKQANEVIVVEGNADVITCHEAGYDNVVGTSGTAFTQHQYEILKRFTNNLVFALDVDTAGWMATKNQLEFPTGLGFNVKVLPIPHDLAKDPDELIRKDPDLWKKAHERRMRWMDYAYHKIFDKVNTSSSYEAKNDAKNEFLDLAAILPDQLERVHYTKLVSDKIGMPEKDLLEEINKYRQNRTSKLQPVIDSSYTAKKSRQELIERRALGFFLKFAKHLKSELENLNEEVFKTPMLREIFKNSVGYIKVGEFEVEKFTFDNPKISDEARLLTFAIENELSATGDWDLNILKNRFLGELRLEDLKRRMLEISVKIKRAELSGQRDEAKLLSSEFVNLSQELTKLTS